MAPGPTDWRKPTAPLPERLTSSATPKASSEARRNTSMTKAIDHPIAFGRVMRLSDEGSLNGGRGADRRRRG